MPMSWQQADMSRSVAFCFLRLRRYSPSRRAIHAQTLEICVASWSVNVEKNGLRLWKSSRRERRFRLRRSEIRNLRAPVLLELPITPFTLFQGISPENPSYRRLSTHPAFPALYRVFPIVTRHLSYFSSQIRRFPKRAIINFYS